MVTTGYPAWPEHTLKIPTNTRDIITNNIAASSDPSSGSLKSSRVAKSFFKNQGCENIMIMLFVQQAAGLLLYDDDTGIPKTLFTLIYPA